MCKAKRLLVFNCSHEMALAANVKQYFPPKNIQQMEGDLCLLPLWWAEEGDAVIVNEVEEAADFARKWRGVCPDVEFTTWDEGYDSLCERTGRDYVPSPWGWNRAMAERFRRYGVPSEWLPTEAQLDDIRSFASREFVCGDAFVPLFGSGPRVVYRVPQFVRSLDFVVPEGTSRLIFKSPWSSSGRGVFVADVPLADSALARLSGFLKTQGGFLVDRFYDKVLDFALEYELAADGQARFLGFSVFEAADGGRYGGNVLASQSELRGMVEASAELSVEELTEGVGKCLEHALGGRYAGIVGVDMLVVDDGGKKMVHPCIEANLRMNMGVLAMNVFERLSLLEGKGGLDGKTTLTPERKCGFVAECVDGRLCLVFRKS